MSVHDAYRQLKFIPVDRKWYTFLNSFTYINFLIVSLTPDEAAAWIPCKHNNILHTTIYERSRPQCYTRAPDANRRFGGRNSLN